MEKEDEVKLRRLIRVYDTAREVLSLAGVFAKTWATVTAVMLGVFGASVLTLGYEATKDAAIFQPYAFIEIPFTFSVAIILFYSWSDNDLISRSSERRGKKR